MLECPKDPTLQPGTWYLWTTGKRRILFACPECSQVMLLQHEIAYEGSVIPIVECSQSECWFRDHVRLVGWIPQKEETDI
jgi:hypothetical protein